MGSRSRSTFGIFDLQVHANDGMSREQVQAAVSSQEVVPDVATEMAEELSDDLSQPVTAN